MIVCVSWLSILYCPRAITTLSLSLTLSICNAYVYTHTGSRSLARSLVLCLLRLYSRMYECFECVRHTFAMLHISLCVWVCVCLAEIGFSRYTQTERSKSTTNLVSMVSVWFRALKQLVVHQRSFISNEQSRKEFYNPNNKSVLKTTYVGGCSHKIQLFRRENEI